MSTKAVIIALVVALLLGIGAYLILQPETKPATPTSYAAGEKIFSIEPSGVASIEIESASGEIQTIRRNPRAAGGFTLTVSRQSAGAGPEWPLEEGRVLSLVRVMNEAPSLGAPDEKAEMDAEAMRVSIRDAAGNVTHMLLGGRTLGGKGLLKVADKDAGEKLTLSELRARPGKMAMIGDSIHDVFRNPGPRAWRDAAAMQGIGPEVSRVQLTNNDLSMKLARLEGKWVVQEPVAAPADAAQVANLVKTLGELRILSFGDEPNAVLPSEDATGMKNPIAVVHAETDRRVVGDGGGEVKVQTETRELIIGKPADSGAGQTRFAQLGKDGPVVVISGAGLARELFDGASYVSKKAVQAPAMDVGMLVLERKAEIVAPPTIDPSATPPAPAPTVAPAPPPAEPLGKVYRRDLDKWKEVSGASEVTLDEAMTKGVEELLKFLTSDDARSLALAPPVVWKEQGQLTVGSQAGTPLETLTLGSSDGSDLGIRTGEGRSAVYRWYPRDRVPRILTVLLPKPTEAVTVPEDVKKQDVVK